MSRTSNWILWVSMLYSGKDEMLHASTSTSRILCQFLEASGFDWPSVLLRLSFFAKDRFCHGAAPPPIPKLTTGYFCITLLILTGTA